MPAAREFMTPLTGSSMATLIVFLPLSFLTGVTGAFSKALSVTMAAALAISWAMTAFVVPILARRLVDFNKWHDPGAAGEGRLAHVHDGALDRLSARPWLLAPVDLQAVKAAGVTFAVSALERVIGAPVPVGIDGRSWMPLLRGEGLTEFDPVRVDRISPEDCHAIRDGLREETLRGKEFFNFGAFFSRSYRENDYLWGRLHGAERMMDLMASTLSAEHAISAPELLGFKRRAFLAILDEERQRLRADPGLVQRIRREVLAGK
jgi:hypothetical protein